MNELTTADPRSTHAISKHIVMLFLESSYSIIALIFFLSSFFAEFVKKAWFRVESRYIYQCAGAVEIQTQLTAELLIPLFDLSDRLVIGREAIECILVFDV